MTQPEKTNTLRGQSMVMNDRRACLKTLAAIVGALVVPYGWSQDKSTKEVVLQAEQDELDSIAAYVQQFMGQYRVPSLSIAIARKGQFVYRNAFGLVDKENHISATAENLYRIASVTKPITSTAVFTLIEQKKLGLQDKVFGSEGVFQNDYGTNLPDSVRNITLYHLLTHTSGGWGNSKDDPMFLKSSKSMNHRELITWAIANQRQQYAPGTHYDYSNFGYCILGRVIEKLTGMTYSDYVQQNVLSKFGISDMRIAGDSRSDRVPLEAVYYDENGNDPYGMAVRRMDSHGGWLATPSDLVEFGMCVTGLKASARILNDETQQTMLTPSTVNPGYACGWAANAQPNWWHDGSLPGTSSILVRTHSGMCWSAVANARNNGISPALDQLMWRIVRAVPAWQA